MHVFAHSVVTCEGELFEPGHLRLLFANAYSILPQGKPQQDYQPQGLVAVPDSKRDFWPYLMAERHTEATAHRPQKMPATDKAAQKA